METSKIGVRYAKAFFELVTERKKLEKAVEDIRLVQSVWKESDDLKVALLNPVIPPSGKKKIMQTLFTGKVEEITLRFLDLILQNRREAYLPDILRRFMHLYSVALGVKPAELVTAVPVSEEITRKVLEVLRKMFQSEIALTPVVQPALIGGFIVRVDDLQIDASIASQLRLMKRQLIQ
ncbi:MAG: ATP synthase F1 subunit delta [Bacteroidales bacterium]